MTQPQHSIDRVRAVVVKVDDEPAWVACAMPQSTYDPIRAEVKP